MDTRGKKTAAAIHAEITREVNQWLQVLFHGRRKTGHVDLEAIEMMTRSARPRVGAAGITELLRFPVPPAEHRTAPCSCGHTAHYQELRSKPVLTAVWAEWKYRVPTICARTVTMAGFRPTSNWISKLRSFLRACAACRRWWARRLLSIMAVST